MGGVSGDGNAAVSGKEEQQPAKAFSEGTLGVEGSRWAMGDTGQEQGLLTGKDQIDTENLPSDLAEIVAA